MDTKSSARRHQPVTASQPRDLNWDDPALFAQSNAVLVEAFAPTLKNIHSGAVPNKGTGFWFMFCHHPNNMNQDVRLLIVNKHTLLMDSGCKCKLNRDCGLHWPEFPVGKVNQSVRITVFERDPLNIAAPLYNFKKKKWFAIESATVLWHPNTKVDLAAIPLVNDGSGKTEVVDTGSGQAGSDRGSDHLGMVNALTEEHLLTESEFRQLKPIEDVIMMGYPFGHSNEKNLLPIVRTGCTASHPQLDCTESGYFVVNLLSYSGSSGSPVYLKQTDSKIDSTTALQKDAATTSESGGRHPVASQPTIRLFGIVCRGLEHDMDTKSGSKKKVSGSTTIDLDVTICVRADQLLGFRERTLPLHGCSLFSDLYSLHLSIALLLYENKHELNPGHKAKPWSTSSLSRIYETNDIKEITDLLQQGTQWRLCVFIDH